MSIYFLTPLYWLFIASTKDNTDLFASFGLWFADFNLFTNIGELFTHQNGIYGRWIINTILYAVVGGAASTLVSAMAGYALSKYRFRGHALVYGLVLGAALVPPTTLAIPIYLLESKAGFANSYWAVLLPALLSPLGVFLTRVYANVSVSDDLIAAARVDGANEFRIFWSVSLPILVPGMITIFLFQFVAIWNNFFLPLIVLSDPNLYPVNLGLATWNFDPASHELLYNLIVTGAFVAVVPVILIFLFLQRYWRAGLSFGSVTG
ncbi:MAG: carbohydrate ABC transporter permease [Ktedonobacterales bacterium]|nr:carbohydrate ABC transporter permease [Ktedonobacterales bacterium]